MSHAASPTLEQRSERAGRTEPSTATLFSVLDDEDCRVVLAATGEEALTAAELGERCDIPSSTVYRKVEQLTEAGLLEERLRVRRSGKHAQEYRRCVDEIVVSLGAGDQTLELSGSEAP